MAEALDAAGAPAPSGRGKRAGLIFILVTLWIDVLSWSVTIPVYPRLIVALSGGTYAHGVQVAGWFMTLFALIQLFASPILGSLSDAYGRRPVILIATAGLAMDLAIMAFAPNLWWLVATRIIHAVTAATNATGGAYIADVTEPKERARAFGYMGAAFSFGFIIGPAIGGALGQIDIRLPFLVGSGLALLNFAYGLFLLPESHPRERRSPFQWRQANPVGALKFLGASRSLFMLAFVNFCTQLAHQIYPALWVLYTSYRYDWSPRMTGLTLAAVGLAGLLVQTLMIGPIVKRVGERNALLAGLLFWAGAHAVEGWAPTGAVFLFGIPLGALAGLATASLSALMSQRIGPDQQGQLQGANAAVISLTGLIGPVMFTGVFSWAISSGLSLHVPGAAFYLASSLVFVAAMIALIAQRSPASAPA